MLYVWMFMGFLILIQLVDAPTCGLHIQQHTALYCKDYFISNLFPKFGSLWWVKILHVIAETWLCLYSNICAEICMHPCIFCQFSSYLHLCLCGLPSYDCRSPLFDMITIRSNSEAPPPRCISLLGFNIAPQTPVLCSIQFYEHESVAAKIIQEYSRLPMCC